MALLLRAVWHSGRLEQLAPPMLVDRKHARAKYTLKRAVVVSKVVRKHVVDLRYSLRPQAKHTALQTCLCAETQNTLASTRAALTLKQRLKTYREHRKTRQRVAGNASRFRCTLLWLLEPDE